MKYLGINLTKCIQNLCTESDKTLLREMKDLNEWQHMLCSWAGKLGVVTMLVLAKSIYRCPSVPFKIPQGFVFFFSVEIDKLIVKFVYKCKRPELAPQFFLIN